MNPKNTSCWVETQEKVECFVLGPLGKDIESNSALESKRCHGRSITGQKESVLRGLRKLTLTPCSVWICFMSSRTLKPDHVLSCFTWLTNDKQMKQSLAPCAQLLQRSNSTWFQTPLWFQPLPSVAEEHWKSSSLLSHVKCLLHPVNWWNCFDTLEIQNWPLQSCDATNVHSSSELILHWNIIATRIVSNG